MLVRLGADCVCVCERVCGWIALSWVVPGNDCSYSHIGLLEWKVEYEVQSLPRRLMQSIPLDSVSRCDCAHIKKRYTLEHAYLTNIYFRWVSCVPSRCTFTVQKA